MCLGRALGIAKIQTLLCSGCKTAVLIKRQSLCLGEYRGQQVEGGDSAGHRLFTGSLFVLDILAPRLCKDTLHQHDQ